MEESVCVGGAPGLPGEGPTPRERQVVVPPVRADEPWWDPVRWDVVPRRAGGQSCDVAGAVKATLLGESPVAAAFGSGFAVPRLLGW